MKFQPETLRKLRKNKALTLEELSKKSGVPVSTIHNLENAKYKSPRNENIEKLATALEVDWRIFFASSFQITAKDADPEPVSPTV